MPPTSTSSLAARLAARALAKDHLLVATTPTLRLSLLQSTATVAEGCRRFGVTDARVARLYGRTLTAAPLLGSLLRGEERAILQLGSAGGGGDDASSESPVSRLYAECVGGLGEVRGFVSLREGMEAGGRPLRREWDGRLRGGSASTGTTSPPSPALLTVTRILYGNAAPVQSVVSAEEGDVEGDVRAFFERSEQVPTGLRLQVGCDDGDGADGGGAPRGTTGTNPPPLVRIRYAGGVLVQRIATAGGRNAAATWGTPSRPFSDFESVRALVEGTGRDGEGGLDLEALHRKGVTLATVARTLLPELGPLVDEMMTDRGGGGGGGGEGVEGGAGDGLVSLRRIPVDYFCRCTKDGFVAKLGRMGPALLDELEKEAGERRKGATTAGDKLPLPITTLTCHFCNSHYDIGEAEMKAARGLGAGAAQ
jgi:molecular chaperone Hsp33